MILRQWITSTLLIAIALTAVVGVCAKTGMADVNATGIFTDHQMDMVDCAAHPRACDSAFADHMRLLSQTIPSLIQDLFAFLTLGVFLFAVVSFIRYTLHATRFTPSLLLPTPAYRLPPPIPLLVFLFSKGILHPKLDSCSA